MTQASPSSINELNTSELIEVALVDDDGCFKGTGLAQRINGELLLPPNAVQLAAPTDSVYESEYFYHLTDDKQSWRAEKKPTTAAECVAFGEIPHSSQCHRDIVLRALFQSLVQKDWEHYQVERGDDLSWKVVAIPEKTEEEKALEAAKLEYSTLKQNLADTDYIVIKIVEGSATTEEYAEQLANRKTWRARVQELEELYPSLKS